MIYCKDYTPADIKVIERLEEKLNLSVLKDRGIEWCIQMATDPQADALRNGLSWLANTIAGREVVSALHTARDTAVSN